MANVNKRQLIQAIAIAKTTVSGNMDAAARAKEVREDLANMSGYRKCKDQRIRDMDAEEAARFSREKVLSARCADMATFSYRECGGIE